MNKSDSIIKLATALLAAQLEMPTAAKSESNPFFKSKYAPLDKVLPAALGVLNKHSISVTQFVGNIDGQSSLTTMLMHTSGEWISADQPLILPRNDPQGQGSAITYARRYAIMSAIGMVADEDDDANAASKPKTSSAGKPPTPRPTDPSKKLTPKQLELLLKKTKFGLKSFDKDEVIAFIDQTLGKSITDLTMGEMDEALIKLDKAIRKDKVNEIAKTIEDPDKEFEELVGSIPPENIEDINLDGIPF